jgi:hypothetical protein
MGKEPCHKIPKFMNHQIERAIVVGVDPAPSKGLCVYVRYPENYKEDKEKSPCHYESSEPGLQKFSDWVNRLAADQPVLLCWDAPLTMPPNFYERAIEKRVREINFEVWTQTTKVKPGAKKLPKKEWNSNLASVQPTAGCSHWVISQKVLGFPSFEDGGSKAFVVAKLIFHVEQIGENGVYLAEVHPALAIQVGIKQKEIEDSKFGGKLSGVGSYKKVIWSRGRSIIDKRIEFIKLIEKVHNCFGKDDTDLKKLFPDDLSQWSKPDEDSELDPSDYLDAWVAMRLGVLWLNGEKIQMFGDEKDGSFLLPMEKFSAKLLLRLEEHWELIGCSYQNGTFSSSYS